MTFLTIFKTLFGLNPDAFTFYGGGGGGGSKQTTSQQLDPTVRPFVEYGLQEAKQLYQSDTPSILSIPNLCRPKPTNTVCITSCTK
jgi:hypothetical protein